MYENYVVPLQRRARKLRQATKGVGLHKTTQSMGTRMSISGVKVNRRPHDPLHAAKFASEAGVVVRSQVPIFAALETLQAKDRTSQWICGQAIYKYVYPLLTFKSALRNLEMDLICIHTSAVEADH